jgi:hypothetical protein
MKNRIDEINWKSARELALKNSTQRNARSGFSRFSTACQEKIHQLKETLTADLASRFGGTLRPETVRQVVNEADALAASTGFPALFLPVLAEEKVVFASQWQNKQRTIRERSFSFAA